MLGANRIVASCYRQIEEIAYILGRKMRLVNSVRDFSA